MKYTVEFELQSDLGDAVRETVYKSVVSALGSVDKLKITPIGSYVGYLQENRPVIWTEIRPERQSGA